MTLPVLAAVRKTSAARRRGALLAAALATAAAVNTVAVPAAHADTDIVITGGGSTAKVVCGNVAAAETYARRHGLRIQRTNCKAEADGGNVALSDVEVHVRSGARSRNSDNELLRALQGRSATDTCDRRRPRGPGIQLNRCWGTGRGGDLVLQNVRHVNHQRDGRSHSRTIAAGRIDGLDLGEARAACRAVRVAGIDQQDDCIAEATAASWRLSGVDVVERGGNTRRNINIDVRGGRAEATIHCFNVADGGRVIQLNVCSSEASGGDVTLRNVTIHTYS
jgi:hypothetical protein